MLRRIRQDAGPIAAIAAGALVCAGVVVLSATVFGERLIAMQRANAVPLESQGGVAATVNRERKGDALAVPDGPQTRAEIKSVEVVGLRGAAIVYRDRNGQVLFRTDPLTNVTVVAKNVELPEVTIRETETTDVERVPVEVPAEEAAPSAPPPGCESAFARPSPEFLTRTPSRCVTELPRAANVAAIR